MGRSGEGEAPAGPQDAPGLRKQELDVALSAARTFGEAIVVEELLEGEEISVFALCDGTHALALPVVQDFKRAQEGDVGPNTGGMGSYSPVLVAARRGPRHRPGHQGRRSRPGVQAVHHHGSGT